MKKESEKALASSVLEGMTSISALLNSDCGNDRTIEKIWVDEAKIKAKAPEISFLKAKSKELGYQIEFVSEEAIAVKTTGNTHGGIIAFCSARTIPPISDAKLIENGFYVYIDGIEDPYNFGYTLRSLYAAGVDGVLLPERNWLSAAGVVARSSAGTSEKMPLFTVPEEPSELAALFHKKGYRILCAEIKSSVSVFDADLKKPLLLIIGGEKRGISHKMLDNSDQNVRIDYGREFRGSLSSASAAAVFAFEILRANR